MKIDIIHCNKEIVKLLVEEVIARAMTMRDEQRLVTMQDTLLNQPDTFREFYVIRAKAEGINYNETNPDLPREYEVR